VLDQAHTRPLHRSACAQAPVDIPSTPTQKGGAMPLTFLLPSEEGVVLPPLPHNHPFTGEVCDSRMWAVEVNNLNPSTPGVYTPTCARCGRWIRLTLSDLD
jgi:hypothetical protein